MLTHNLPLCFVRFFFSLNIFFHWSNDSKSVLFLWVCVIHLIHCTEVHFVSLFSGRFSNMTVLNPPEKKLAKSTSDPLVRQTSNIEFFVVNIGNHSLFLLINWFSQIDFQVKSSKLETPRIIWITQLKFIYSEKAAKFCEISTNNLDFAKFFGLLRMYELYLKNIFCTFEH